MINNILDIMKNINFSSPTTYIILYIVGMILTFIISSFIIDDHHNPYSDDRIVEILVFTVLWPLIVTLILPAVIYKILKFLSVKINSIKYKNCKEGKKYENDV